MSWKPNEEHVETVMPLWKNMIVDIKVSDQVHTVKLNGDAKSVQTVKVNSNSEDPPRKVASYDHLTYGPSLCSGSRTLWVFARFALRNSRRRQYFFFTRPPTKALS